MQSTTLMVVMLAVVVGGAGAADEVTDIVINEIMYNPASGDRDEDFIELYNRSPTQTYNLKNWKFTSGINFTFPDVNLGPQQFLVVCANEARIRQIYGITETVGDWDPLTSLDNGGERLKLVNDDAPAPLEIEDFTYDDRNPWPILADGYGHSLERRNPAYDNDKPANWAASGIGTSWTKVVVSGLATSSTIYLYLSAAGFAYVDDIRLYPTGNPGDNRIQNGGFESASLSPWAANGNHSGSVSSAEQARGGSRSLKLVATGAGASSSTSVTQGGLGLTVNNPYTLEFWAFVPTPGLRVIARLSQSSGSAEPIYVEGGGGGATPGRQNSMYATDIPPFVYPAGQSPAAPKSTETVTITSVAIDDFAVASVTAHWDEGAGEKTLPMKDDGLSGDGAFGDGVYGASIGKFSTGKVVMYWVTALDSAGQEGRFPFSGNPTAAQGFYVEPAGINPGFAVRSNSGLISNKPGVYHLLIDPAELGADGQLKSPYDLYRRGTFIFNGEVFDNVRIRHRGQSSLGVSKKHWKVNFNKDHRFRTPFDLHPEVDNINIQSSYGDKTFLREWLSYKAWMDVAKPGLEMWHARMYLNGAYRGLYVHLENPNEDFLDRTGLDSEGWLWKSYSEAKGGTGGFEMEVEGGNAAGANAALGSFISNMNTLTGQALVDAINANMNVAHFIDFLAIHQLIHNADHPAKNYLVYADEDTPAGTWTYYGWDMDLTHGRNYECSGGGVYNDTIRYDFWGDPQLLFGTRARPKCDGPWNGVIDAFLYRTNAFRAQYYDRVAELLDQLYQPAVLNPIIDNIAGPLGPEAELDWNRNSPYGNRATYGFHLNAMKGWAQNRYNTISSALQKLTAPELTNLACSRSGGNADLSWTNRAAYSQIKVYRNNDLLSTLAGNATSATAPLDLNQTVNTFRVASVVSGAERAGETCAIVITSGGYTTVISQDFSPPASPAELSVNCSAVQENSLLQLTPPSGSQAGSAFFLAKLPVDDFIAEFDLRFDEPSAPGADGIAFILNTGGDTASCGAGGGAVGYFTADGGAPAFPGYAIVFDTWQNDGEISHNWVGFFDAGAGAAPQVAVDVPEEFNGNGPFHAKVIGSQGVFTLLLSNSGINMAEREIFTHAVPGFNGEDAFFGFSAGTGGAFARHLVDNFILQIREAAPEPPVADFSAVPLNGTAPLEVSFTDQSSGGQIDSWSWNFGDGQTSGLRNPAHLYQNGGTYTVTLTVTGPGGSDQKVRENYITASNPIVLVADFTAGPTSGPKPLAVQFTNQSTGPINSYLWEFGDGQLSIQKDPSHTYQQPGQYSVTLRISTGGQQDSRTRANYILVDDALAADFTASPVQGPAPLVVNFTDRSQGSTILRWIWGFGDGSGPAFEQNPQHTYSRDGSYNVTLQIFGFTTNDAVTKSAFILVGASSGGLFIRGDANGGSGVDISDAIYNLTYQFIGGVEVNCQDALDVTDNGEVDITDAIVLLKHLFQGGDPPAPPYPDAGPDPTADGLPPCQR